MEMIGKAAFNALNVAQELTVSPLPAAKSLLVKPIIRLPETVEEARTLKAWANATDDTPEVATVSQLSRHLEFMAATLPTKAMDEEGGKKRVAVYARILGDFSNGALAYMTRKACETLDWFPTPRQCLDILREYRDPATDRDKALMLCHRFWQGRFEDFIAALKAGTATDADVDAVPGNWRAIAMEQGHLRWIGEQQRYVIRRPVIAVEQAA